MFLRFLFYLMLAAFGGILLSCNGGEQNKVSEVINQDSLHSCMAVPSRFSPDAQSLTIQSKGDTSTAGMKYISGGSYMMGGDNDQASKDEFPKHQVKVNSFWMDETEVTNAQFQKFVDATGYITTAEQKPDWE